MSEQIPNGVPETSQTPAPSSEDAIKNLKAEFQRKLDNQNTQMQQLLASLTPKPASETKRTSVFDDEEAFARSIEERTERRISEKLAQQSQHQTKYQSIVNQLTQEYPEANDTSSDLYKKAQEHFATLADDEKSSPLALKASVSAAAAELGLKPKSKRTTSSSEGYVSASSSPSNNRNREDIDSATLDFAQLMGLNTADSKVRANLQNRQKRK